MYAAIRRYTIKGTTAEELARRADEGIVPTLREVPGFLAYYLIGAADDTMASVSVFETREGAEQSTRLAADWVKRNLAPFVPTPPQVTTGDVLVQAHATREANAGR
jgi:Antibiotic biosynthesis monooxygenase